MSRKTWLRYVVGCVVFVFALFYVFEAESYARIGGGGSFGSRGSRSYSSPSRSYSSSPSRSYQSPSQPYQPSQPRQGFFSGGGFFRSMAGGIAGGFLGSMLFRGLGFGGAGGWGGGGGIGIFEILLLALILYLLYRFIKKRRMQTAEDGGSYQSSSAQPMYQPQYDSSYGQQPSYGSSQEATDVNTGLRHISQLDPAFDEARFRDTSMDTFFKLQGAWGIGDLSSVRSLMTDEVYRRIEEDASRLRAEKKINKLDNIAVRSTDIVEAWQESGQDYITVHFYANLVDYTIDIITGQVISGSKTDPVKFEEYWTFTRPAGSNPWKLSAINQP
jgi:predicted lipid-binding transport protein (Tim44 family)